VPSVLADDERPTAPEQVSSYSPPAVQLPAGGRHESPGCPRLYSTTYFLSIRWNASTLPSASWTGLWSWLVTRQRFHSWVFGQVRARPA